MGSIDIGDTTPSTRRARGLAPVHRTFDDPANMNDRHPLQSSAFRVLWASGVASAGAYWMERVATSWLALYAAGGPVAVGIVTAARLVPFLLFGLAAGTLADRGNRRRQLQIVALSGAVLAVALALLAGAGVSLLALATISFLTGCLQVFDTPPRQALIYDTVGRQYVANAVAVNAVAARGFGAIGALGGGFAVGLVGVSNCYVIVALAYAIAAALLSRLSVGDRLPLATPEPVPFGRGMVDAAKLIARLPGVRTLVIAAVACEVFGFSYLTAMPVLARDVFGGDPQTLGALNAAAAIGGVVAVLLLSAPPAGSRREPWLAATYLFFGAALLALAATTDLTVALAASVIIGGCAAAFDTLQRTLIQLAVPEDQRGRALGIWILSLGSAPIGHLEMGALAAQIGPSGALALNSAFVLLGAIFLVTLAPRYRLRAAAQEP